MSNSNIKTETLINVVSKMLDVEITSVDYQAKNLEGGTIEKNLQLDTLQKIYEMKGM